MKKQTTKTKSRCSKKPKASKPKPWTAYVLLNFVGMPLCFDFKRKDLEQSRMKGDRIIRVEEVRAKR